jgi:hypothetical protein
VTNMEKYTKAFDDVIDFSSFQKGQELLKKYGVEL